MCPWVLQASMQSSQESLLSERRDDETYTTLVWQVDQKERNQQKTEGFFPGLHQSSGITPSQKCLDLEEKLYGSLGYVPEYPRKHVVSTVQSLL